MRRRQDRLARAIALSFSSLAALALLSEGCSDSDGTNLGGDAAPAPDGSGAAKTVDATTSDGSTKLDASDASPTDAGADASDAADAADAADASDAADAANAADAMTSSDGGACGTAPLQVFDPITALIALDTPKTDVTVTANICSQNSVIVPYKGSNTMSIQRNTPFFFIGTQTGNLTTFSQELNVTISAFPKLGYEALLIPTTYATSVDPTWTAATKALLRVVVNASTGTGTCSTKDGVSYTVVNHPEAVIRYEHGGVTGTGTGTSGDSLGSWISIVTTGTIANPEYVTITQTKAGCQVGPNSVDKLFATGRAPVAAGVVTSFLSGEVTN